MTKTSLRQGRPLLVATALVAVTASFLTTPHAARAVADGPGASVGAPTEQDIRHLVDLADELRPLSHDETASAVAAWKRAQISPASGIDADLTRAQAFRTPETVMLRIPFVEGSGILSESSITAAVTGGRISTWSELVLTPRSADAGRLQTWVDGIAQHDQVVTAAPVVRSTWWSRFTSCLNNAGVAAWAITALSIACSAACVVTAGVGCIACITAAGAATSGTISFCAGYAIRG